MALSLQKIEKAYELLKEYKGNNSYIIRLKNTVIAHQVRTMNDFESEYVLSNFENEPRQINKVVKIADWYGEKLHSDLLLDFVPKVLKITWYLGEVGNLYHFYCIYRKSQDKAIEVFAPKRGILTDFLLEDYHDYPFDETKYITDKRRPFQHQIDAAKFMLARKKCIVADEMGGGKCEPLTAQIPTPNGFVKMGDIKIGDKIFGSDGKEHNVLGVFPQGKKKIYKVFFSDHTFCRCGEEHLWIVKKVKTKKDKPWKVMSLKEILDFGIKNPKNEHENLWKIPMCKPVEYAKREHFINPYLLGVLIGDGNLCNGGINISIPDFEKETAYRVEKIIGNDYILVEDRAPACPRYRIIEKKRHLRNPYIAEIKRLKLNVKGKFKFIPKEYMFDSIENRIELLRGLMDTDGSICDRNRITFSTSSEQLANDVKELVYSLGGRTTIYKNVRKNRINKNGENPISYRLTIQIEVNPFKLERKAKKYHPTFLKYCSKYICKIEEDGEEEAQCIYVDSKDHSYLTGHDYIVTHNTNSAILASLEGKFEHILIISPSSVKKTWENELKYYVDDDDITIVQGSKWDDAKFTIINYDILDNFYEIPEQTIKTSELNVDDNGNIKREYKDKKIVSRSKKIIDEAMSKSQLFQSHYDLVIIDEAHRLSNNTSTRFKIISDLLKRSKPNGIFLLTGTMITNSSRNLYNILKLIDLPITRDWQYFMERYCGARFFYKKNEKKAYTVMFLKEKEKDSWYDLTGDEKEELDGILEKKCKKLCIPGEDTNMEELQEIIKPYYLRRLKTDFTEMVTKTVKYIHYEMSEEEKRSYDELWEKYLELQEDKEKTEKNKKLIEISLMRQWLADKMIPKTIDLVKKCVAVGRKVVIFCAYDNEINKFVEEFKDICVFHNGKINEKKKNEAVERFQNDDNIKVFIGNIFSAGVGLTLTSASVVVFNNFSFVPSDCLQCEDRVYRIGQDKPCTIYYQSFNGTYFDKMLEIVHNKNEVINKIIITEKEK